MAEIHFPAGFRFGASPAHIEYEIPLEQRPRELYISYWLKVSPNWFGQRVVSKIGYAWIGGKPMFYAALKGAGRAPLSLRVRLQDLAASPREGDNLRADRSAGSFERNRWHHAEFLLRANTPGVSDGEAHWWLDGRKVGEATDIRWVDRGQSDTWDVVSWRPVWGGRGGQVPESQHMWMDHLYVSGK